jgi:hypothetical protein
MSEPTLVEVFGDLAAQDSERLIISKFNLEQVGLTPALENTAESLFTAIIKFAKQKLNSNNQFDDSDIQITVGELNVVPIVRNEMNYDQYSYTVNFDVPAPVIDIDPDSL